MWKGVEKACSFRATGSLSNAAFLDLKGPRGRPKQDEKEEGPVRTEVYIRP